MNTDNSLSNKNTDNSLINRGYLKAFGDRSK